MDAACPASADSSQGFVDRFQQSSTTASLPTQSISVGLSPVRIRRFLITSILFLHVANAARLWIGHSTGHFGLLGLGPLFDVDEEGNLPSLYSALSLAFAGLLAHQIASRRRLDLLRDWKHWYGISFTFFFLAVDESIHLHELLSRVGKHVASTGVFVSAWVIPVGAATAILGVFYLPMLLRLPRWFRARAFIAAAVFLSGALGMEMLAGPILEQQGRGLAFDLCCAIEELLEMTGVAIWICALVRYLQQAEPQPAPSVTR
jgi:hypothetical protein